MAGPTRSQKRSKGISLNLYDSSGNTKQLNLSNARIRKVKNSNALERISIQKSELFLIIYISIYTDTTCSLDS